MTSANQAKRCRIGVSAWSFHTLFEPDTNDPGAALTDVRDFPEMIADRYHVHHVEIAKAAGAQASIRSKREAVATATRRCRESPTHCRSTCKHTRTSRLWRSP